MTATPDTRRALSRLLLIAGGACALALPLVAQDAPPPSDPPADSPKQTEPAKPADQPAGEGEQKKEETIGEPATESEPEETDSSESLDLDELLRIPGSQQPIDRPTTDNSEPESELDRRLTDRQAQEALVQAVQEMGEVADRLEQLRDAGVVTQRLQQEIITKLDILIKSAESQQNSSSSSSSSSQQQNQQGAQQQTQQSQSPGQSAQSGETPPPARQREQLNEDVDLTVAEWGNLPERLRESLIQGQSDYFSDMYKRWTESYYRRLAEEANR